uniref:uncharacterized protein LOC101301302 isoform X2 n=1 Tax=Fragaria vesca subsp. vesca TaxID=101020 RepID=UPI0005CB15AD|nr:PREDICTED: uncharacterized protein LOC101301302 isoform X2 [Fragaria vesca subsp. vesca]
MLSPVVDSPSAVGSTAAGATHSSADRIVVEPVAGVIQDTIYVTVGACVKESKSHLLWTLHNSGGNRVCIIHVHQPAQKIPTMMGSFPASQLNHQVIRDYRQIERQKMQKILEEYLHICRQMGVRAEILHIEMDSIEKGIVELISQHGIRKLVMGTGAVKTHGARKMRGLMSKKAIYVREHAPVSCHIQFVYQGGCLIQTREAKSDAVDAQVALLPPRPSTDTGQSPLHLRSRSSVTYGQDDLPSLSNPAQRVRLFGPVRLIKGDKYGGSTTDVPEGFITPSSRMLEAEGSADEYAIRRSASLSSIQVERTDKSENGSGNSSYLTRLKDLNHSSPPSLFSPPESLEDANFEQKLRQVQDEHETLPHHLKRLFLYCSLFPFGYEFSKDGLVQLWIAEGFIRERQRERMEDTATEHFNSLEKEGFFVFSRCDFTTDFDSMLSTTTDHPSNFLYKVNPRKHSLLENTISSGNYFKAVDGKLDGASHMTRHLSLIGEDIDGVSFGILQNFKHLRSLHMLSCRGSSLKQVPRDLCFTLTFLKTLNLSGTLISELPSSIGNVKSLRYIDASHTPIARLPESIDSLYNLQTIKLRGCSNFVQLPKGMKKLTNLRHIDLDIIRQLDSLPAHLGNLSTLQTLSAFLVGRDDGCHVGELKNLNDLKGALNISRLENVVSKKEAEEAALIDKKCLDRLELRWSNMFVEYAKLEEEILECLQPHFGLKELQIQQYSGSVLPTWIGNRAFADLVAITLYRCRNCKLLPCMGQLPALKSLSIIEMNGVKYIDHQFLRNGPCLEYAFPKLERLEVDIMLKLKVWKHIRIGDFPSLVKLIVDSCPELVRLPPLACLPSLKHLELRRCPKLLSLPSDGLPPSLESFLLVECLELKEWCLKSDHWSTLCHISSIWFDHEEVKGFELDCTPLWGSVSICGRRPVMEDAIAVVPRFINIPSTMLIGSHAYTGMSPSLNHLTSHFFGVYDGHGGPQVAEYCCERLHLALADELQIIEDDLTDGIMRETQQVKWEKAFTSCFRRVDDEVSRCITGSNEDASGANSDQHIAPETVGSTAVVALVCSSHIIVANCGDSRAILCRGKEPVPLSVDHKANREDECARIEASGGKIIQWNGPRVFGVLAMSRSIGDGYLKPWIIPDPEVMIVPRTRDDEFLILASDGLWDVMTNKEACKVARRRIRLWHKKNRVTLAERGIGVDPAAQEAASYLSTLAFQKGSTDNISVILVDMRAQRN